MNWYHFVIKFIKFEEPHHELQVMPLLKFAEWDNLTSLICSLNEQGIQIPILMLALILAHLTGFLIIKSSEVIESSKEAPFQ